MPVVQVRVMRMLVPHRFMPVGVGVRFGDRAVVVVPVVVVVGVGVFVFQGVVAVGVFVAFGQMQPDAEGHQHARRP